MKDSSLNSMQGCNLRIKVEEILSDPIHLLKGQPQILLWVIPYTTFPQHILRSSPIFGYPCHVCKCPGLAVIEQNGRKRFFSVFRIFRPNRKRKSGFLGTVGIPGSSPIRRYPVEVCRCTDWATIMQNGKTSFPALARSGSGIPDFWWHQRDPQVKPDPWVPLPCL